MMKEQLSHMPLFHPRRSVAEVEDGFVLAPRFSVDGLLPWVTTDARGDVVYGDAPNPTIL